MAKYTVLYKNLKSDETQMKYLKSSLSLKRNEKIGGFQRGLVVLRDLDSDKTIEAYSFLAYFLNQKNIASHISFKREPIIWKPYEVKRKLSQGHIEDVTVEINENQKVQTARPTLNILGKLTDELPLEEYLLDRCGGMSKFKSAYMTAIANTHSYLNSLEKRKNA